MTSQPVSLHAKSQPAFRVGFVLVEQFTLISLASAIEPLRMANHLSGQRLYEWCLISLTRDPVSASGGSQMLPDTTLNEAKNLDLVLVAAGVNVKDNIPPKLLSWLKTLRSSKTLIGGLCTGPFVLAQAGLLNGYSCSAHWECIAALQEDYPRVYCNPNLFTFDRDRLTCTGGDVPLHMMMHLVASHHGPALANGISDMFVCDRIRDNQEPQRLRMDNHVFANQPKLATAVQLMEANIEEPMELAEIAAFSGVSRRQLERLFLNFMEITPSKFYLKVRLERAKQLLHQTTCPIVELAAMCGFQTTAQFNRAYRKHMGRTTKAERALRDTLGSTLVLTEESTGLVPDSASKALDSATRETSFGLFSNR